MTEQEIDKKKKSKEKPETRTEGKEEDEESKTIVVSAGDIQSLVLDSVSDLLEKGVLEESKNGTKIDIKDKFSEGKEKEKKQKKKDKED